MTLSLTYQSIINSLDIINQSDSREFSIIWQLPLAARIVYQDSHIHTIRVDNATDLDLAVADYLIQFATRLIAIREHQRSIGKPCPL